MFQSAWQFEIQLVWLESRRIHPRIVECHRRGRIAPRALASVCHIRHRVPLLQLLWCCCWCGIGEEEGILPKHQALKSLDRRHDSPILVVPARLCVCSLPSGAALFLEAPSTIRGNIFHLPPTFSTSTHDLYRTVPATSSQLSYQQHSQAQLSVCPIGRPQH
jgi:hypothetical protein